VKKKGPCFSLPGDRGSRRSTFLFVDLKGEWQRGHERQPQIALIHLPTFSSAFTNGLLLSHFVECNALRPKYIRRSWPMIYSTSRILHCARDNTNSYRLVCKSYASIFRHRTHLKLDPVAYKSYSILIDNRFKRCREIASYCCCSPIKKKRPIVFNL